MRLFDTLRQKLGRSAQTAKNQKEPPQTESSAGRSPFAADLDRTTGETGAADADKIERLAIDAELLPELRAMAAEEKVPVEQLTDELLRFAVAERRSEDHYVELWHTLTPREQETAALTCLGYTNRQIAGRMFISTNTVKTHVRHILNKFEINSKSRLRELLASWDFETWLKEKKDKG